MNTDKQILIVDDEQEFRELLSSRLTRKGYRMLEASNGVEAIQKITSHTIHLILLDLNMPIMDGMTFLQKCKDKDSHIQIIVLTGHGTIETAIEAMKCGAYDYLTKPYRLKELEALIEKALEKQQLEEENFQLKQVLSSTGRTSPFIAESPAMKRTVHLSERVALTDSPVLLKGESGTGKEVLVRFIYECSKRNDKPLIPINMGAIPEMMLESELFGHEKGAFTGAVVQKKGLVELADQGTLFLDEIGDLPYPLQVKLLRFLETGEFRRVGGNCLHHVDVRILAATNVLLEKKVEEGSFRADLYYRLNVVDIEIPPLRERKEDILPLSLFFLAKLERKYGKKILSAKAQQALLDYSYPGNVRELAHIIERGVILSSHAQLNSMELFSHIPQLEVQTVLEKSVNHLKQGMEESLTLKELEERHILQILQLMDWNKTKAAERLGISVRNLYRKIEEFQLKP